MLIKRIGCRRNLMQLCENISALYSVQDAYILRCAVLEVLQNTLQHSDGRFLIEVRPDSILIINLIKATDMPKNGLGLKLYSGIETHTRGNLHYAVIYPHLVNLQEVDVESLVD